MGDDAGNRGPARRGRGGPDDWVLPGVCDFRPPLQDRPFLALCRFVPVPLRGMDWGGALSRTTKSAASHVKGGFWRRSVLRWSVPATGREDARRSSCRRSHKTTTGSSAAFRVSPSTVSYTHLR